jgi:chromosome segregation ATPase
MSETRRSSGSSTARIVLGVLTLVLLVGFLLSMFLLGRSVEDAEADAQTRAVNWTNSVLVGSLTDAQVQDPLLGPEYRDVLVAVQNGIRSDPRAARVRIWNGSGMLIFSDDPDEKAGTVVATDVPEIRTAFDGQAVSVTSEATVPAEGGLTGTDEQVFQTYVPFRPDAELGISGVVQIDQLYDEIVGGWSQTWTAIRLGLGIALAVVFILFLVSLRRRPAPVEATAAAGTAAAGTAAAGTAATQTAGERRVVDRTAAAKAEERVRELGERLARAEAARSEAETIANEASSRFAELEDRVAKAEERATSAEAAAKAAAASAPAKGGRPRRGVPGVGAVATAASVDVDARVQQAEAERERLSGEVGRLRSALAERDAELALAREEGGTAGAADVDELRRQAAEHEQRATQADERATEAEHRIAELEGELQAAHATAEAKPKRGHRDRHADDELRAAREQATEVETKLAETSAALEEARGTLATGDERASELEAANTRLIDELETLRTDAVKASDEIATLQAAVTSAQQDASSKEVEERVAAAAAALAEAQGKLADSERDRAELLAQLERYRQTGEGAGSDDIQVLRGRVIELEDARRADVAELQRAQETLANTQFEATQARKQVKELEKQLRKALIQPAAETAEPAQEPEPAARSRRRAPKEEPPEPVFEPEEDLGEAEPEEPEQELSLRERLARAAAARHRMTGPPGSE